MTISGLLRKACAEKNFDFALQLCSLSHKNLGPTAAIYECSSDIYLNLRQFIQSEVCLLQALAIDGPSPKRLLNLASFAFMRGDIKLANYHLSNAAALDPSHPQLKPISDSLKRSQSNKEYKFISQWIYPDAS